MSFLSLGQSSHIMSMVQNRHFSRNGYADNLFRIVLLICLWLAYSNLLLFCGRLPDKILLWERMTHIVLWLSWRTLFVCGSRCLWNIYWTRPGLLWCPDSLPENGCIWCKKKGEGGRRKKWLAIIVMSDYRNQNNFQCLGWEKIAINN